MAETILAAEAVQLLIDSASDKSKFDKSIEHLISLPAPEFLVVCMQALSREPAAHLIRLQLSKLLLQLGCYSFAIEQLKILKAEFSSQALNDLLQKIEQISLTDQGQGATLASFDIELLDPE